MTIDPVELQQLRYAVAVAETGTLCIVTNEGNGCMTTTLPPIYVAVVGYEKLVSSWEDATAILRLLSRSTMGMKLTVYVSHITGRSHTAAIPGVRRPARRADGAEIRRIA